jgi:plastocyanin
LKKSWLLVLIVPLVLGLLVACGDDDDDDDGGDTTPTTEATDEATEEPTDEATEEATEEATDEATEEATEEATDEATEEAAGSGVLELSAANIAFSTDELTGPAGEITIEFSNNDSVPHNVAIYADEAYEEIVFEPDGTVDGGGSTTYEVGELEPAEYYFRCEVHPTNMEGVLIIE